MTTAAEVIATARAAGQKITTAESCTGGLLAAALTDISGASKVFDRGFVTYSYESKPSLLGLNPDTLAAYGAVSAESAAEMAKGALARSAADIAIAITGVAGPVATADKPEGLVWFAVATAENCETAKREFGPIGRANVRQASIQTAFNLLGKVLALPSK